MKYFQHFAPLLWQRGYITTPVNGKRPVINDWVTEHVTSVGNFGAYNVGILCGQGEHPITALDIDVDDAELTNAYMRWVEQRFGAEAVRVGRTARRMVIYRVPQAGIRKVLSKYVQRGEEKYKIEWLGFGQQFAAYGIHPDTKNPYEWTDVYGGLAYIDPQELPLVTLEEIQESLDKFYEIAEEFGYTQALGKPNQLTQSPVERDVFDSTPVGLTLDDAMGYVRYLSSATSMSEWLNVGMALHHEFSASEDAMHAWDEWSCDAANYVGLADVQTRWNSFGKRTDASVTMRTVIKRANEKKKTEVIDLKTDILAEIKQLLNKTENSFELLESTAKNITKLIDNDLHLQLQALIAFKARYKDLCGATITDAEAKKHIRVNAPLQREFTQTEFANCQRFMNEYGHSLMYVPEPDVWYTFEGTRWVATEELYIVNLVKQTITDMIKDVDGVDDPAGFVEFCKKSQTRSMVENVFALAKSKIELITPFAELNKHKHLVGTPNGTVDLRNGTLKPPNREVRITQLCGANYVPDAQCPAFEQTLSEVFFGDQSMIDFFHKIIGYSLLADPKETMIFMLFGKGSNGKSTLLTPIQTALGDYAKKAEASTFMNGRKGGSGPREDVTRLAGSRFIYASEPDSESVLCESLVKDMTGGEPITARAMYAKNTITIQPEWVVFLATNHLPIIKGTDFGIWRRIVPIPFTRNFQRDKTLKVDLDRSKKIGQELEGILAWCVRGALKYRQEGLALPLPVTVARNEYMSNMDLLSEWMYDRCDDDLQSFTTTADLYNSFRAHAGETNLDKKVPDIKAFTRKFAAREYERTKIKGQDGFIGIKLKVFDEDF